MRRRADTAHRKAIALLPDTSNLLWEKTKKFKTCWSTQASQSKVCLLCNFVVFQRYLSPRPACLKLLVEATLFSPGEDIPLLLTLFICCILRNHVAHILCYSQAKSIVIFLSVADTWTVQFRIHLVTLNLPLLGDKGYGRGSCLLEISSGAAPSIVRQFRLLDSIINSWVQPGYNMWVFLWQHIPARWSVKEELLGKVTHFAECWRLRMNEPKSQNQSVTFGTWQQNSCGTRHT